MEILNLWKRRGSVNGELSPVQKLIPWWPDLISQEASHLFLEVFIHTRWHSPRISTEISPCPTSDCPRSKTPPQIHCLLPTPAPFGRGPVLRSRTSTVAWCSPGLPCPCHSPFTSQGGGRGTPGKGRAMPNHRVGRGECLHKRCSTVIASVTNNFSIAHVGNYQQVTRWEGTNTALHWAALGWCWVYFYALNKQNQSPRVKARSQLFWTASFWNYTSKQY